jgi:hypothetical protein
MGAFLGLVLGLFVGFCGLSSVGAGSIDLQDLYEVLVYAFFLFVTFFRLYLRVGHGYILCAIAASMYAILSIIL